MSVRVGREAQLEVIGIREHLLAQARPDLHHLAHLLTFGVLSRLVNVERNATRAASLSTDIHTAPTAAGGLVDIVLQILVGIENLEGRNTEPLVLKHLADRGTGGGLHLNLLEAAALAISKRTSEGSLVVTVDLAAFLSSLGDGNGEGTKSSAEHSNAATSVLGGIHDVLVYVLHGGDLELGVGITSKAQFHQPSLSGLFDKQVRVIIQQVSVHCLNGNRGNNGIF